MKRYVIAFAIALPLAGCGMLESLSESAMTVEEQAQLDEYQEQIAVLEQKIRQIEQEAEATFDTAVAEVGRGETSLLAQRLGSLLELQEDHEALVAKYTEAVSEERELLDGALKQQVSGVLTLAAPFIPAPIQPLIPFASTLLVFAVSSRARKHAGKAIAALAKGNLAEMAAALLKASGAAHSSPATKQVAEAEAKGEEVTVQVS
jgi:hypothetical protein